MLVNINFWLEKTATLRRFEYFSLGIELRTQIDIAKKNSMKDYAKLLFLIRMIKMWTLLIKKEQEI